MVSQQAPPNWPSEALNLVDTALDLQEKFAKEEQEIYDQGLRFDWQQQPMTPDLAQHLLGNLQQKAIELQISAQKPPPILHIIDQAFDELRTSNQSPPPIVTRPAPTQLPTEQTPPVPAGQLAAMECSVGNLADANDISNDDCSHYSYYSNSNSYYYTQDFPSFLNNTLRAGMDLSDYSTE